MSGPKRNPDKLNTLGVVVIGICASVLVYVTIVALQAFYMKDTSDIQHAADYGGNDVNFRSIKATATTNISEFGKNADGSFRVHIDVAMQKVLEDVKKDPAALVPGTRSDVPSAQPIFGRAKPTAAPAAAGSADAGSAAAPADAGSGSAAAPADAGSAAPAAAPTTPTGGQAQGGGPAPAAGADSGSAAKGNAP